MWSFRQSCFQTLQIRNSTIREIRMKELGRGTRGSIHIVLGPPARRPERGVLGLHAPMPTRITLRRVGAIVGKKAVLPRRLLARRIHNNR